MARIVCRNGSDFPHLHTSVPESRACWQRTQQALQSQQPLQSAPAQQLAGSLSYNQNQSSKIEKFLPMLELVPEGYYAVSPDADTPLTFLRLSRPTREDSKLKGCTVIQRVSGPDLDRQWICRPAPTPSPPGPGPGPASQQKPVIHIFSPQIEDSILLLISDYRGAALRYAQEIGRCCRCNTRLTDERSRYLGVGPECIKHMPWMEEMVEEYSMIQAQKTQAQKKIQS